MSFGADTDYWTFKDTATGRRLISASETPNKSEGQAQDSNGDVAASSMYDCFTERTCVYELCGSAAIDFYDTTSGVDFRLGKVIGGHVLTSIEIATENTARPRVTMSGQQTASADSAVSKYEFTELNLTPAHGAQKFGASVDTVTNLLSSSITASVQVARSLDSAGDEVCSQVYGGRVEATNNFVGVTGNPGAAADTGWTLSSGPSDERENTAYGTGSVTVFKNKTKS